jgi:phosphatidate cytidylyltransferase
MTTEGLWHNPDFFKISWTTLAFIYAVGTLLFLVQRKNVKWIGAWASVKSWMLVAPFIFAVAALPSPWPFVIFVMTCIYCSKTFFRMTGMYHRSWFVWASYLTIGLQGYLIYYSHDRFFNLMPMVFFVGLIFIPLLRNSATHMIQYIALSLMNFIFFGWGLMHLGRIINWEDGLLIAIHLGILAEFSQNMQHLGNRLIGGPRPFSNITSRFSLGGYLFSVPLTLFLAFGMRGLLPSRAEAYWLCTGLAVLVFGRLGHITLSIIRRDLGIKEAGVFIIGRDDLLSRLDSLMFVSPVVYYGFLYLSDKL